MSEWRWDEMLRQRQKDVDRLVDKYGLDGVREALESVGWSKQNAAKGGRTRVYDAEKLREVYIFVETGIAQTKLSVNELCKRHKFRWLIAGTRKMEQSIEGPTLRRRYYEAKALLDREVTLERAGADRSDTNFMSSTERWWREELERRRMRS